MSEPTKAVFLSYAREDAAAAKRIADALRAFGVEVWFDQDELRGGDAWDAKIRGQIKACALFIPLVSQKAEERSEGYFRREWKLAVDRTHDMAGGRAFIVPVVIDDTAESGAAVPEEFMKVQWTRLAGGEPSPEFVTQVKRLLDAPRKPAMKPDLPKPPTLPPHLKQGAAAQAGASGTSPKKKGLPGWAVGALIAVVGFGAYIALRPTPVGPVSDRPNADVPVPPPATPSLADSPSLSLAPPTADAKSIAVLPFANLSPDKENEFFTDGMHDEVITALAKIRDLTVISRTSVLAYRKAEDRNLRKIAAELGVAHMLEGSVQRAGDRVKVIVQLIDARTDRHLWAETYVESLTDVFTIQSKLAGDITKALKATLSPEEKSRIAARPTSNPEAYDFFLRARARSEVLGAGVSRETYDGVVALYERAVALDPAFLRAQAELCYWNGVMYWFGNIDPTPARRARARAALDAALRHGPDLPETRMARGAYLYTCENDWAKALVELRAAEAGLPNDAQLIYLISLTLRRLGRVTDSLADAARSVELNPRDINTRVQQLLSLRALHRHTEWHDLATRYLEQFPDNRNLREQVSAARLQADGDRVAYLRRQEELLPNEDDKHGLIKAYRLAVLQGDLAAAERALADPRLTSIPGRAGIVTNPVALHRALVAWQRGSRDQARTYAEEAVVAQRAMASTPRQEPWMKLGLALAQALAGRADEAVQLLREGTAQAARDGFNAFDAQIDAARVYLVLDRRDDALACLRAAAAKPSEMVPAVMRLDPFWARLKDDPRFEEVLKSVKPL